MSFYSQDELLRDETYWTTKIQLELFRQIEAYLKTNQLSRSDFARQLGVSKGYVSQVLNGNYDHKLSKFVSLCLAMEKVPILHFQPLDRAVERAAQGQRQIVNRYTVASPPDTAPRSAGPTYQLEDTPESTVVFPVAA